MDDGVLRLLFDVGCGSGLLGDCLIEFGYEWIGMDLSVSMLEVVKEREVEGDVLRNDMGYGVLF